MKLTRRRFLQASGTAVVAAQVAGRTAAGATASATAAGDLIGVSAVSASTQTTAGPATKVIDGLPDSNASRWVSAAESGNPTLTMTLAQTGPVSRFTLVSGFLDKNGSTYQAKSAVRDFRIEGEVGGAWKTLATVTGNDQLLREISFTTVTTQRLRLVCTTPSGLDRIARVFEVYAFSGPKPMSLRQVSKPNLTFSPAATIENADYRLVFLEARWDGGRAYVHDLFVRNGNGSGSGWTAVNTAAQRFDDQWIVYRSDRASVRDFSATASMSWITFSGLTKVSNASVTLTGAGPNVAGLKVTWDLSGPRPVATFTVTAAENHGHIVGWQSVVAGTITQLDEVLCGPLQHAKVVTGRESVGAWSMTAPLALTQRTVDGTAITAGVYRPADALPFESEHAEGSRTQRYGMSLRGPDDLIRPIAYHPQPGEYATLLAGKSKTSSFGLVATAADLTTTYENLIRSEYAYTDFRQNVYGQSLTDTMYNLIALVMNDSGQDDSVEFRPSPSGWWTRAKGFVDPENYNSVRTTSTSVLLQAYLLTGDDAIYDRRARPNLEFQVSRNNYGWSPVPGTLVYGAPGYDKLCAVPFDASTLAPLFSMTGARNAGIRQLALTVPDAGSDPGTGGAYQSSYFVARPPWAGDLARYRMTGQASYLTTASAAAKDYIAANLTTPYTSTDRGPGDFQYFYVLAWTELLELFEATGDTTFRDAAHREARRYLTQVYVRPVPNGSVSAPTKPITTYTPSWKTWGPKSSGDSPHYYRYPKDPTPIDAEPSIPAETTADWIVATNGATFETIGTFQLPVGGYTLNPAWAPFLARLAHHTGDQLMADVARNSLVGRYTNYPGYYNRQFMPPQLKADYPVQGPNGIGSIYYSHIPVQLGMTVDWLITEQQLRSNGQISFPSEFEANYVWFKYHTYGHKPGSFYGDDNVWLWMPRGIVTVSNPQVNWVTAEGNGRLYVSLTNAAAAGQTVTVTFGAASGISSSGNYHATVIKDNGARQSVTITGGKLATTVSARGITAVMVDGVNLSVPLHHAPAVAGGANSYHFDDNTAIGKMRAMLLVKPDGSRYDAYVQTDAPKGAWLHWSTDGGLTYTVIKNKTYPYEWTVPVTDVTKDFTYWVGADGVPTDPVTLSLS